MTLKAYYQDNFATQYQGHVLDILPQLEPESIQCCVTSPPYWGLRDYGLPPQIWDDPGGCEHEWGQWKESHDVREEKTAGKSRTTDRFYGEESRRFDGNHQKHTSGQFCLRCNAWRGSLGLEPTPELYIQHIVQIFREVKRVLRKDGTLWLNMGSSYASGKGSCFNPGGGENSLEGHAKLKEAKAYKLNRPNISDLEAMGFKPKDLIMIPAMVALALQADGWWLRSDIIWAKKNCMPESCTDRPTSSHEYVFLLSKSGTPKFWTHRDKSGTRTKPKADYRWVNQITKEEVSIAPPDWKEKIICPNCEGKGRALIDLSYECLGLWTEYWKEDECPVCEGKKKVQKWKRINLWQGHDYFYDADAVREPYEPASIERRKYALNKTGKGLDLPGGASHTKGKCTEMLGPSQYSGRNLRSVWTIATEPTPEAHFATFPEKLVIPCIKAGTSEKGCCPECGSPWTRVTERIEGKNISWKQSEKTTHKHQGRIEQGLSSTKSGFNQGSKKDYYENAPQSKTLSWKPTCTKDKTAANKPIKPTGGMGLYRCNLPEHMGPRKCGNPKTIPCTVLDPFSGSGKVLTVAKKLFRKAIGIELNATYCKMPVKKLKPGRLAF